MRLAIALVCAGCGRVGFDLGEPLLDGNPPPDTPLGAWTPPVLVVADENAPLDDPSLTSDQLELYVNADTELRVLRRTSTDEPWGPMEVVTEITQSVTQPAVSGDGLSLYLSNFSETLVSTRADRGSPWSLLVFVPELNLPTPAGDVGPRSDELEAAVMATSPDRIHLQRRGDRSAPWGPREEIAALAAIPTSAEASFGEGGLALYFGSFVDGVLELYRAERSALDQPFGLPAPITELNSFAEDSDPWVSDDGRTIYFTSSRGGEREIWMSTR